MHHPDATVDYMREVTPLRIELRVKGASTVALQAMYKLQARLSSNQSNPDRNVIMPPDTYLRPSSTPQQAVEANFIKRTRVDGPSSIGKHGRTQ